MTFYEILTSMNAGDLGRWAVLILVVVMSLIEIAPVKLNPWKATLGWLGKRLNGAVEEKLREMETKIDDLEKHTLELWINQTRSSILIFARECRANVTHDSEEWANVLNNAAKYEAFIRKHNYPNGVVQSNIDYIRNLYQDLSRERKI